MVTGDISIVKKIQSTKAVRCFLEWRLRRLDLRLGGCDARFEDNFADYRNRFPARQSAKIEVSTFSRTQRKTRYKPLVVSLFFLE